MGRCYVPAPIYADFSRRAWPVLLNDVARTAAVVYADLRWPPATWQVAGGGGGGTKRDHNLLLKKPPPQAPEGAGLTLENIIFDVK